MKTATVQGDLWGARAKDWTELCEPVGRPAVEAVFARAGVGRGTKYADLGCGAGGALVMARERGADVTGFDASEALVVIARSRVPGARIEIGDLEELPFEDQSFDVVTGFNSFQFVGDIVRALREAARVTRSGGLVGTCLWCLPEECESVKHSFAPVMAMLPPPPPPTGPPISTPGEIEQRLASAGLTPEASDVVDIPFLYRSAEEIVRGFTSAGIMIGAIRQLGEEQVRSVLFETLEPFTRADGSVLQKNRFRWVLARKG